MWWLHLIFTLIPRERLGYRSPRVHFNKQNTSRSRLNMPEVASASTPPKFSTFRVPRHIISPHHLTTDPVDDPILTRPGDLGTSSCARSTLCNQPSLLHPMILNFLLSAHTLYATSRSSSTLSEQLAITANSGTGPIVFYGGSSLP